jgi:hypothetical protein
MATGDFTWLAVNNCLSGGGGVSADCPTGLDGNGIRYDSPTFAGFSVSGGEYENYEYDIALKYAADWNSIKVSAAYGYTENTDEGCNNNSSSGGNCTFHAEAGGGGAPFQGFHKDVRTNQVGASVMHVPSGLWIYGMYQNEQNDGTPLRTFDASTLTLKNSNANTTNFWFMKAGIKRTWTPLGATVIWGEGGQADNEFGPGGLCGLPGSTSTDSCDGFIPTSINPDGTANSSLVGINSSTVNRWGAGVVQEIDSAAMHVFFRWQHLNLDLKGVCDNLEGSADCLVGSHFVASGNKFSPTFNDLDLFQVGGVIFF